MTKAIAIYSPKGGVGKTTLTLQLADAIVHRRGASVHVLDRDNQGSVRAVQNMAEATNRKLFFTRSDGIPDEAPEEDVVLIDHSPIIGAEHVPPAGVDVLVVPVRPSYLDMASMMQFKDTLEEQGFNIIYVLNGFRKGVRSHEEAINSELAKGWLPIADRNIYQVVSGEGTGVFSYGKPNDFTREGKLRNEPEVLARQEILALLEAIERYTGPIAPSSTL